MAVYAVFGSLAGTWMTLKAGSTLPIKITKVDISAPAASSGTFAVNLYTGGGVITGGSTATPFALRDGSAAAGATSKAGATAVTGTSRTFTSQSITAPAVATWSPPSSLIIAAGSSTVFVASYGSSGTVTIYFDELEIQPGF